MRIPRYHRWLFTPLDVEARLMYFSGVGHLGSSEFDNSRYNLDNMSPEMAEKFADADGAKPSVSPMSAQDFRAMMDNALSQSFADNTWEGNQSNAIRQKARAHREAAGKRYNSAPTNIPQYTLSLREQLGSENYDRLLDAIIEHVWKMPDMQRGVIKTSEAVERSWNLAWDIVQKNRMLPPNHPYIKRPEWKNGNRVPGAYYEGRLVAMSSRVLGAVDRRALSEESKRFSDIPTFEFFGDKVNMSHRGLVEKEARIAFSIPEHDDTTFNRLRWNVMKRGDDKAGTPHVYTVQQDAGQTDDFGEIMPGQEPMSGVVFVYGNRDDLEKSEVIFINFDDTDRMLHSMVNDPFYNALATIPGFFNPKQAEENNKLLRTMPPAGTPKDNEVGRDLAFYSNVLIGRMQKEATKMQHVTSALQAIDIKTPEDLAWLKDFDTSTAAGQARAEKVIALLKAEGGLTSTLWKRAMKSLCPGFVSANGEKWYERMVTMLDSAVL